MYNEVLYLISYVDNGEKDKYGDPVLSLIKERRFAKFKSISQSEFYQAQTVGIKPEIKLELADYLDYSDQEEVLYNDVLYKVLRTYRTSTNSLEMTLYGGVRNGSTQISDKVE